MKDEEMAEERATKFTEINYNEPDNYGTEKEIGYHAYYCGFLAGLKAGRPQWHYVKDGDLPEENQKCYFIYSNTYDKSNKVIFEEGIIQVRTGVYSFFVDEETGEETTEPCFYDDINDDEIGLKEVYAWKEIVLPELPKEK